METNALVFILNCRKGQLPRTTEWFQSFTDDMKKSEEEKMSTLKKIHEDQELNSNIMRMLTDELVSYYTDAHSHELLPVGLLSD